MDRITYIKKWRKQNPDKVRKYKKKWNTKNPNKVKQYTLKWQRKNKKKLKEYRKKYYQKNGKRLYLKHRDKNIERSKKWYYENKKYYNQRRKRYLKKKRKIDISFKLLCYIRNSINKTLKTQKTHKDNKTIFLLGCTISELKIHLQKQFKKGMNWNNYGKWHIDHIKPCASFDLSKPKEQQKCFHYTNLQPLWAIDNMRKGDNFIKEEK